MANSIIGTRSPNGAVGVSGVIDSGELSLLRGNNNSIAAYQGETVGGGINNYALSASGLNITVSHSGATTMIGKDQLGQSDLFYGTASFTMTMQSAPGTSGQSRIDAIVVYKDTTVVSTQNNGFDAMSYQVVTGTAAAAPVAPTVAQIRAAITNGATAFICVLGIATIAYGQTTPVLIKNTSKINTFNIPQIQTLEGSLPISQTTGTLAVARGGTGQTTLALARNAMGLGNTTGALPIANGGSGMNGITVVTTVNMKGINVTFRKWGLVVSMSGSGVFTSSTAANTSIGTVPTNMRPASNVYGITLGTQTNTIYDGRILATGEFNTSGNIDAGNGGAFNVTYLTGTAN